jgi:molybdenum cofactor cytidylyltransferase
LDELQIAKQGQSSVPGLRIGAVLLAAGAGSRMGHRPKSLLQLEGISLLERQLQALSQAGVEERLVVLGYHANRIQQEAALSVLATRLVIHPQPEAGHVSSLRIGLQALSAHLDAVLVALADQPLINAQDVLDLINAFKHRPEGTHMLQPTVQGLPANPVMFTGAVRTQILAEHDSMGKTVASGAPRWRVPLEHTQHPLPYRCGQRGRPSGAANANRTSAGLARRSGRLMPYLAPKQENP